MLILLLSELDRTSKRIHELPEFVASQKLQRQHEPHHSQQLPHDQRGCKKTALRSSHPGAGEGTISKLPQNRTRRLTHHNRPRLRRHSSPTWPTAKKSVKPIVHRAYHLRFHVAPFTSACSLWVGCLEHRLRSAPKTLNAQSSGICAAGVHLSILRRSDCTSHHHVALKAMLSTTGQDIHFLMLIIKAWPKSIRSCENKPVMSPTSICH